MIREYIDILACTHAHTYIRIYIHTAIVFSTVPSIIECNAFISLHARAVPPADDRHKPRLHGNIEGFGVEDGFTAEDNLWLGCTGVSLKSLR